MLFFYGVAIGGLLILLFDFLFFSNDNKFDLIMATLKELSEKVDALQAALDAEQEQIKNAIDTLQATVDTLNQNIADGGTAEERQAVADKIDAVIVDLQGTIADAPAEEEETPTEETPEG